MKLSEFATQLEEDPAKLVDQLSKISGLYVRKNEFGTVLLTSHIKGADFSSELNRYANGLLFSVISRKILVLPSQRFNKNVNVNNVIRHLSKYTAYPIQDGTVVNLHFDDRWVLSSANSWDVSNYFWFGDKTYMEAFTECASIYPEFSLDKLDKSKCYTIGFRHHSFHPLLKDPQKLWFIQSCDLGQDFRQGAVVNYTEDIGIPVQRPVVITKDHINQLQHSVGKFIESGIVNYGYVLRGDVGAFSNLTLESKLMEQVRVLFYNIPKKLTILNTPHKRVEYNILKAYLSGARYNFQYLFPQFNDRYKFYDTHVRRMASKIVAVIKSGKNFTPITPFDHQVSTFLQQIKGNSSIDVRGEDGMSIVVDFITHKQNLNILFAQLVQ